MDIARRAVLQATGLVALGGVVAACGPSESATPASSAPAAPSSAAASTSAPASSAPASSAPASSAPASSAAASSGGTPVAAVSDIPVGGGVILDDPGVVITQPTDGEIKAFSAICTHQGCLVEEVVDNEIVCPCHGSRFSAVDGSVVQGPATVGLATAGVVVDAGNVVLS